MREDAVLNEEAEVEFREMMARLVLAALLLFGAALALSAHAGQPPPAPAQPAALPPGTDIWLARLTPDGAVEMPINITRRPGYDNQPSFTPDGAQLLFTRGEDGQTDIWAYDFTTRSSALTPITRTPESEYSATITPDGAGMSVIRVEADGTQRLWRFTRDGASPALVLRDVKPVGYHAWIDGRTLALFVLGEPNTLQLADPATGRIRVIAQRIGRSLHRIPGRRAFSFLHMTPKGRWIKSLDPDTRRVADLVEAPDDGEGDYAWTPDGAVLMAHEGHLRRWRPGERGWTQVANLAAHGLHGVTRLAVSPDARWIALVAADEQ